ncbi:MAG: hypothetical protein KDC12_00435 [Flavobacteriales bacterium]|nr:hypothetical protein [Flavobacteriales bacterium]
MKTISTSLLTVLFALLLGSCGTEEKPQNTSPARRAFDAGTDLCLEAETALREGDPSAAQIAAHASLAKFDEVLKLDPEFAVAKGAKAHAYYLLRDFTECTRWYQLALLEDSNFVSYHYEMGLCLIEAGNIPKGMASIEKAAELGKTDEIMEMAGGDLLDIAGLAYQMSDTMAHRNDFRKASNMQRYAVGVLMAAHQLDSSNTAAIRQIVLLTEAIGDTLTANRYRNFLND